MRLLDLWGYSLHKKEPPQPTSVVEVFPHVKILWSGCTTGEYNKKLCLTAPDVDIIISEEGFGNVDFSYLTRDLKYVVFKECPISYEIHRRIYEVSPPLYRVSKDMLLNAKDWNSTVSVESSVKLCLNKSKVKLTFDECRDRRGSLYWTNGNLSLPDDNLKLEKGECLLINTIYSKIEQDRRQIKIEAMKEKDMRYKLKIDAKIEKLFN